MRSWSSTDVAAKLEKVESGKLARRVARKHYPDLARKGRCCAAAGKCIVFERLTLWLAHTVQECWEQHGH